MAIHFDVVRDGKHFSARPDDASPFAIGSKVRYRNKKTDVERFGLSNDSGKFRVRRSEEAVSKIDSGKFAGLSLADPGATPLAIGDLLWASRTGKTCRKPPSTFAEAKKEVKKIRQGTAEGFCSHADIVVAIRDGEADVIGGNVHQATTRTTYKLDSQGRIRDGRRAFVGVIKNAL